MDGSDLCERVLPYIEELAVRLGSELILLHVCPAKLGAFAHKHEVYIEHMARVVREHLKGEGKVEAVLLAGDSDKEIIAYAKREDISLVAMMTHGHSGIKRWFLGSTADKVIREAGKSLLVIRAQAAPAERERGILNRVLVPLDGSELAEVALSYVEELVAGLATKEAEVTLLKVIPRSCYVPEVAEISEVPYTEQQIKDLKTQAEAYLERVGSGLRSKGINTKYETTVGSAAEEIISFADKIKANLTAMSMHGESGYVSSTLGSTVTRILHHGDTPLLLVNGTKG